MASSSSAPGKGYVRLNMDADDEVESSPASSSNIFVKNTLQKQQVIIITILHIFVGKNIYQGWKFEFLKIRIIIIPWIYSIYYKISTPELIHFTFSLHYWLRPCLANSIDLPFAEKWKK